MRDCLRLCTKCLISFYSGKPGFDLGGRLAMDNLQISRVGDVDDSLRETLTHVRELDLTKNCLTDWTEVNLNSGYMSVRPLLVLRDNQIVIIVIRLYTQLKCACKMWF